MRRGAASAHDCDAVVVGGGPAGATAAARLAAEGFTTIVVDRATFPRDKVCGDFVGPAALAELADLGVTGTEAFAATNTIGECALHIDGDQLGALAIPQVGGLPAHGRVIPRQQLDAWILDAARRAGTTVLDGRKVTAVEQAPDAVTVHGHSSAGPWQLRTRLLVGADGSNSIIARALRGTAPPRQDRIVAVRAYFDDVGGPASQADICLCSDSFPGYSWLFPCGSGQANVGVGMVVSTYPQAGRNLRELLLRLIAEDPSMRHRLGAARIRGKVLGCPLTTYNPRLPLVGDRVMLVGDAAGLINPLNGEGIQYALHSARWAADVASDCLSSGRLDAASLHRYQQRVQHSLGQDMAFSRLVVQLIRNRALNPVWLRALRVIASRAQADPDYAYRVGCVVTGLAPATKTLSLSMAAKTAGQARISARSGVSGHHRDREFADWAGGVGRALTDLLFQLSIAKLTRNRSRTSRLGPPSGSAITKGHKLSSRGGPHQRSQAGDRRRPGKTGPDMAGSAVKERVIYPLQTRVINPIVMLAHDLGIPPPGDALLETTGRRTGRPVRTPVCDGLDGETFWLVAQRGRRAGWVRNIQANQGVRVKVRTGSGLVWRAGTARILDDDDPRERQRLISRGNLARRLCVSASAAMGTDALTVRIDFDTG